MKQIQQAYVNIENSNGIGIITFFHPSHNSLPGDILSKLAKAINQASDDEMVKVIVLKSGGDRTFCAGANFDELMNIKNIDQGKKFFSGFAKVINACRKSPKFIIGRVQGKAVGGGVGIISATDYCMATKYAAIKLSELSIGIGPFVVEPPIQRKIGITAISQLTINATHFQSAEWAKEKGLYTEIFTEITKLDKAVDELATKLSSYNPKVMQKMKQIFWQGTENWDELLKERASVSGSLVLSDYTKKILQKY